ncbi:MAG: hypothetical protein HC893_08670, partial [Chloroflexaceae bacterium]|nr:hypothetical protein [Chloroflexaceae bacterium]
MLIQATVILLLRLDADDLTLQQIGWDTELQQLLRLATHRQYRMKTYLSIQRRQATGTRWATLNQLGARLIAPALPDTLTPDQR